MNIWAKWGTWAKWGEGGGSSQTYSISGTVEDGDAAAIEGVTITLSGDASDSTTTDSNGDYTFESLSPGSYTVTPSASGMEFSPASTNVTITNANQTGKDFTQYLALPYNYDVTAEVSETSGGVAAQLSDWTARWSLDDGTIVTSVADNNSFTPSGVTKGFNIDWDAAREGLINDLPCGTNPLKTSIRMAVLAIDNQNRAISSELFGQIASVINADAGDSNTARFGRFISAQATPDRKTCYSRYGTTTTYSEINNALGAVDMDARRYHWLRSEWDFVAETVTISVVRAEDDSLIWTDSEPMNAVGIAYGKTGALKSVLLNPQETVSNATVVRYWIGTTDDAWPSVAP